MKFHKGPNIRIHIPQAALLEIFDECDKYDFDETGGRLVGTFKAHGHNLTLHVTGVIEPGPNASRSPTSLFQDGPHQESVFRMLEEKHPDIEHLGTWHTHHVNGLQTLSGGDLATYGRTVNHENHNTNFFYALLVTTKNKHGKETDRYQVKHFVFVRGDDHFHEIPASHVSIENSALVWPGPTSKSKMSASNEIARSPEPLSRVSDRDVLGEFFPAFRPFSSSKLGIYWRGMLPLADGSTVETVVVEDRQDGPLKYTVTLMKAAKELHDTSETLANQLFLSARLALMETERACNRAIVQHRSAKH